MENVKFKTSIKCAACVAAVTPFLNQAVGEKNWRVDLIDPLRTLTIIEMPDQNNIIDGLAKAGYKAERL